MVTSELLGIPPAVIAGCLNVEVEVEVVEVNVRVEPVSKPYLCSWRRIQPAGS
jgi:hypothetical protein